MEKVKTTFWMSVIIFITPLIYLSQTANSLSFDGINDYVGRSIFSTQQINVTFEARVKVMGASLPSNRYILANGTGTTGFGLFLNLSNQVNIRAGSMTYTTAYTPPPGTFVLLSVVVTPNFLNFYVNGVLTNTFIAGMVPAPSNSFIIGSRDGTSEFFNGDIDEVRYWIRAVCQQEISHRANCSATGLEPQLAALYKFNQGIAAGNNATVTTLNDQTPNMHNANLNNFALNGSSSNWINSSGAYGGNCSIAPLTLTITPSPIVVCFGQSVTVSASGGVSGTYTWNTGQNTQSIVITPTTSGIYSVIAQTSSSAGICYGMAMAGASVIPLPTITVNSATICSGQSAVLTATGASSYTWSTGANTPTISVSPSINTTYTVTGSNGSCSNSNTTQVTVNSNPTISVTSSTICSGQSAILTASGATTYSWSTGANTSTVSVNPTSTTVYTVIGINGICTDTKTTQVTVNSASASILSSGGNTVCTNNNFNLTAGGNIITYTWNTGANTNSISQNISTPGTYTYSVIGTAANGCTASAVQTIVAQVCGGLNQFNFQNLSFFPNPFNEIFEIKSVHNIVIQIFDINGKQMLLTEGSDVIINTENWLKGIYIVEIEENNFKYRTKIIKN